MLWNTKSWNACCVDGTTGATYPWSREELIEALVWGAQSVPTYGVILWEKAVQKEHAKACLRHFLGFLRAFASLAPPKAYVAAEGLYRAFLALYALPPEVCSKHRFGVAMTTAIKSEVLPFIKFQRTAAHTIHYRGLTTTGLEDAFSNWVGDHPPPLMPDAVKRSKPISGAA